MINTKKILVIGGSGGIGRAIEKKFPKLLVQSVGTKSIDLSSNSSIEGFFKENLNKYEILIFVSGINNPSLIKDTDEMSYEKTIKVNCSSLHFIMSKNYKCFSKLKSIVAIGSLYASFSRSKRASYTISKHGLFGLIKTLAIELAPFCNVNMVSPGFINTRLTTQNNSKRKINKIKSMIPQKKLGSPSDIANAVYFLTEDSSKYINGINLTVDGGFSCGGFQGPIDE